MKVVLRFGTHLLKRRKKPCIYVTTTGIFVTQSNFSSLTPPQKKHSRPLKLNVKISTISKR